MIHHGVEREFFEVGRQRQPGDFLLCVSTLHPHKNLERLIRASMDGLPRLVITGLRGFEAERLEQFAGPGVQFTGWIPREQLYELFRTARGFVYPSTFEGFGMPVLEAMAAGVPVACSDIPPLREIADGCVSFFDPLDEASMRDGMLQLLNPSQLTQAAQARAAEFTWEKTARATLQYLTQIAHLK